jgi:UMF1 family MFS transporter
MLLGRVILAGVESLDPPAQTARYVAVFSLSAGLFLILAIPCFVLVKERVRERQFGIAAVPRAFRQVGRTLTRELPRHRNLVRFLIGRFFYTDAVNTVILFMGIYVTNAVGFTTGEASLVMLIAIVAATAGGLGWGRVVDVIGPKRTLEMVLGLWIVVFAWTALVGFLRLPPATFWPVPCLAGIALGGTWTADRPLLLRLSPPEQVGEFYGLYGMMSRFSAIVGPQLWRLVSDTLGLGRPAAVMCLLVFIVIAMVILRPLPTFPAGDEEPENDRSARGVPIS